MLWIKRNLFTVIGGVVALGLLGFGGYWLWANLELNEAIRADIEQKQAALTNLYNLEVFPDRANIENARRETEKIRAAIVKTHQFFAPVPHEKVTGQAFKRLLDNTLSELHKSADSAGVELPKNYAFSFEAQKAQLQFAPNSFPLLPEQLAEVKTLCNILFEAKINKLLNLRRVPVSSDDFKAQGSSAYLEHSKIETDDLSGATTIPYQVEFEAFTPHLAAIMESLARSPYGLAVRTIMVLPAVEPAGPANPAQPVIPGPGNPPVRPLNPNRPGGPNRPRPGAPPVAGAIAGAVAKPVVAAPSQDGLQTVLDEKALRITMVINVVKPGKK